jgi:hypothetical protein
MSCFRVRTECNLPALAKVGEMSDRELESAWCPERVCSIAPGRRTMSLSMFLESLLRVLEASGILFCFLRNYEEFPERNAGSDIDILVPPFQVREAIQALSSIDGVRIVGLAKRYYATQVFVEGVATDAQCSAMQVDFFGSVIWKGLPILETDEILHSAGLHSAGKLRFPVPHPAHEAILSLLSSLLVSGFLKEKYICKVQNTFATDRVKVIAALETEYGPTAPTRLVNAVAARAAGEIRACIRPLRASRLSRSLLQRPILTLQSVAGHYIREMQFRISPRQLESIFIIAPERLREAGMIDVLVAKLGSAAKIVRHRPSSSWTRSSAGSINSATGGHDEQGKEIQICLEWWNIFLWLIGLWKRKLVLKRQLTLEICDVYYPEFEIRGKKRASSLLQQYLDLFVKICPEPDLWIVLARSTDGVSVSNPQSNPEELPAFVQSSRGFGNTRQRSVVLDANQPSDFVIEMAYESILDALAARADGQLRHLNRRMKPR